MGSLAQLQASRVSSRPLLKPFEQCRRNCSLSISPLRQSSHFGGIILLGAQERRRSISSKLTASGSFHGHHSSKREERRDFNCRKVKHSEASCSDLDSTEDPVENAAQPLSAGPETSLWESLGSISGFNPKPLLILSALTLALAATSHGGKSENRLLSFIQCQPALAAAANSGGSHGGKAKPVARGTGTQAVRPLKFQAAVLQSNESAEEVKPTVADESHQKTTSHHHKAEGPKDEQANYASLMHKPLPQDRVTAQNLEANGWWPRRVDGQRLGLNLSMPAPRVPARRWNGEAVQYSFDVLMERHPTAYVMMLMALCGLLVTIGGFLFQTFRTKKKTLEEDLWAAWGNVISAREHLRESSLEGRTIGFLLTLGGLFCYSILTSTITANVKMRLEWLREGAHSQVIEKGHIVVGGFNHHLPTLLRQISKSHEYAVRDGTARSRRQVVLLLTEMPRKEAEKRVGSLARETPHLRVLFRSGSLSSTGSFKRVAADNAHTVILLAAKDDYYEADADAVTSVMALLPLVKDKHVQGDSKDHYPAVVVEVSKGTTARLLHSLPELKVNAVEDLSAKLFVQCCRQPGLVDVYARLLDHTEEVINLRNFPTLAGLPYKDIRRGFKQAVVCGVVRDGKVDFHPADDEPFLPGDKLMVIAEKLTHRGPPASSELKAAKYRASSPLAVTTPLNRTPQKRARTAGSGASGALRRKKRMIKLSDETAAAERILVLGWRLGVPDMIREYDDYVGPGSELVVLAPESIEEREALFARQVTTALRNLRVVHKVGNPMSRSDMRAAIFDKDSLFLDKMHSDSGTMLYEDVPFSISVISARSWRTGDNSKPDKQSLYCLLLADSIARDDHIKLQSLSAEFQDKKLAKEVLSLHPRVQYVATSDLMGLVTSQVTEHNELNAVWSELLNAWGDEIYVKDIKFYKVSQETLSFAELEERAVSRKEVAIGYRKDGVVVLNPLPKNALIKLSEEDNLIVISEF